MTRQSWVRGLLAVAVCGLCGCPNKGEPTGARPTLGPRLELAQRRFDAGEVDYGREYRHTFRLANTGDQPLQLTVVHLSCSCGEIQVSAEPIAPGASADVVFVWRPIPGNVGPYTLAVDLDTNDADETARRLRLEMTGRI